MPWARCTGKVATKPRRLPVVFLLLGVITGLCASSGALDAHAQPCSHFLNASDGDDGNDGSQTSPVRSVEFAFSSFPNGSTVCMAAGEYYFGADADGIQLAESGKSMVFRLESFAGGSEVRFSEKEFSLDVGTGTVTFEAGSTNQLVFGLGVENSDDVNQPDLLNFLHTVRLASGTLAFNGFSPVFEAPVGNPDFEHPSNSDKSPPAEAGMYWDDANVTGIVTFEESARTISFNGLSTELLSPQLPVLVPGSKLFFSQSRPLQVSENLDLSGVSVQLSGSAETTFSGNVAMDATSTTVVIDEGFAGEWRLSGQTTLQSNQDGIWLEHAGTGAIRFSFLALESPSSARTTLLNRGNGSLDISTLSSDGDPGAGTGHFLSIQNLDGSVHLGETGGSLNLMGSLVNSDQVVIRSATTVTDQSGGNPLLNTGTMTLENDISLAGSPYTVTSEGALTGAGKVIFLGDGVVLGNGIWPESVVESGASVSVSGSPSLDGLTVSGDLSITEGASVTVTDAVSIGSGSLSVEPGAELITDILTFSSDSGSAAIADGGILAVTSLLDASLPSTPFSANTGTIRALSESVELEIRANDNASMPPLETGAAIVQVSGGSTWAGFAVGPGTLTAQFASDAAIEDIHVTNGGVISLSTTSTLLIRGNNIVDETSSLALDAPDPIELAGSLITEGGAITFPPAGLTVTGSSILSAPVEHAIVLPALSIGAPESFLEISGSVALDNSLFLRRGSLYISEQGRLSVAGDLGRSEGNFALESTGAVLMNGESPQRISGFTGGVLPSIYSYGPNVLLDESATILGSVRVVSGQFDIAAGSTVNILADLSVVGGTIKVNGDASILVGTDLNLSSGVLDMDSGSLRIPGNVIVAGGSVLPGTSTWTFTATEGSVFLVEAPVSLATMHVEDGVHVDMEGGASLQVQRQLLIDEAAIVIVGNASLEASQGSQNPVVVNDGAIETRGGSLVLSTSSSGRQPVMAGAGVYGDTVLELDSDESVAAVQAGNGAIRLGGELSFLVGGLELNGAEVIMDESLATDPALHFRLSDANPANGAVDALGFLDSLGPIRFNVAGTPFHLRYSGQITTLYDPPSHIAESAIEDLTIQTEDPVNTPAIFGLSSSTAITASGHLTVDESTIVRLQQPLRLNGDIRRHVIHGRLTGPSSLVISGQLNELRLLGAESSIESLRLEGSDSFSTSNLWLEGSITSLESISGQYTFQPSESIDVDGVRIQESASLSAGEWTIGTPVQIGSQGRANSLQIGGTVTFSVGGALRLTHGGTVSASSTSAFQLTEEAAQAQQTGFMELLGSTSIDISAPLPRLRINIPAGISDDVFLQGDLSIQNGLELINGDINLGGSRLILAGGTHWIDPDGQAGDGSFDGIVGDVSQQPGTIEFTGPSTVFLGGTLGIQDAGVILDSGTKGNLVSFASTEGSQQLVSQTGGYLQLDSGTLDLANNDWVLSASTTGMLRANGGHIGNPSTSFGDDDALTILDDDLVGELVLVGSGNASIEAQSLTSVDALRVEGTVRLNGPVTSFRVVDRFVFGERGASFLTSVGGELWFETGIRVIRRGQGALSHNVASGGPFTLAYELGDGTVTGNDTGFASGTLNSGPEVQPGELRRLIVAAGAGPDGSHRVSLTSSVTIEERLEMLSGSLQMQSTVLRMRDEAELSIRSLDVRAPSTLSLGQRVVAFGRYAISVEQGRSRLDIPANLMASTSALSSLDIAAGHGLGTIQESVRLLGPFTADTVRIGSGARPVRLNLSGHTLRASQHLDLASGTVTSSQPASMAADAQATLSAGATVEGNIQMQVDGPLELEGRFAGLELRLNGDATLAGSLAPATRIMFSGSEQTLTVAEDQILGTLVLEQDEADAHVQVVSLNSPVDLLLSSGLELNGGRLSMGENTLTLNEQAAVTRNINEGTMSHVVGTIRRPVSEGSTREVVFPLGNSTDYLPLTLTFSQPLLSSTELEVALQDPDFVSMEGLPLMDQEAALNSMAHPLWSVSSTVDFAQAQRFSVAATLPLDSGIGGTPVRLMRQAYARGDQPWAVLPGTQLTAVTQEGVIVRTFDSRGGLVPRGVLVGIGVQNSWSGATVEAQFADVTEDEPLTYRTMEMAEHPLLSLPSGVRATRRTTFAVRNSDALGSVSVSHGELAGDPITTTLSDEASLLAVLGESASGERTFDAVAAHLSGTPGQGQTGFHLFNTLDQSVSIARHEDGSQLVVADAGALASGEMTATQSVLDLLDGQGSLLDVFHADLTGLSTQHAFWITHERPSGAGLRVLSAAGTLLTPAIVTGVEEENATLPLTLTWHGNYPNPFAHRTRLSMELGQAAEITVDVFDMLGRRVRSVDAGLRTPGPQEITLDGKGLASGVYLVRVSARGERAVETLTGRIVVQH